MAAGDARWTAAVASGKFDFTPAVDPGNGTLYACEVYNGQTYYKVDPADGSVLASSPTSGSLEDDNINSALIPDGSVIWSGTRTNKGVQRSTADMSEVASVSTGSSSVDTPDDSTFGVYPGGDAIISSDAGRAYFWNGGDFNLNDTTGDLGWAVTSGGTAWGAGGSTVYAVSAGGSPSTYSLSDVQGDGTPAISEAEDKIVIPTASGIEAFDTAGNSLWVNGSSRSGWPVFTSDDQYVYFTDGGSLTKVDAGTGSTVWSKSGFAQGGPAVTNDDGAVIAGGGSAAEYAPDGTQRWSYSGASGPTRSGVVLNGVRNTAYICDDAGVIHAVEMQGGSAWGNDAAFNYPFYASKAIHRAGAGLAESDFVFLSGENAQIGQASQDYVHEQGDQPSGLLYDGAGSGFVYISGNEVGSN